MRLHQLWLKILATTTQANRPVKPDLNIIGLVVWLGQRTGEGSHYIPGQGNFPLVLSWHRAKALTTYQNILVRHHLLATY